MIRGAITADLAYYDTDMYAITSELTLQCHLADRVAATARAVAAHVRYRTQPVAWPTQPAGNAPSRAPWR